MGYSEIYQSGITNGLQVSRVAAVQIRKHLDHINMQERKEN